MKLKHWWQGPHINLRANDSLFTILAEKAHQGLLENQKIEFCVNEGKEMNKKHESIEEDKLNDLK